MQTCCACRSLASKQWHPHTAQVWAYQNHANANRHPENGGDEGDLGRLPGLVVLRQVRRGRLAGKAVAKEDRLCTAGTAVLQAPQTMLLEEQTTRYNHAM